MKKTSLKVLIASLVISTSATAETTNAGYTGCLTEDYYGQMMQAVVNKDNRLFEHLTSSQKCVTLSGGLSISVLDRGFSKSKIKIYVGDSSVDLYVPNEMIKR